MRNPWYRSVFGAPSASVLPLLAVFFGACIAPDESREALGQDRMALSLSGGGGAPGSIGVGSGVGGGEGGGASGGPATPVGSWNFDDCVKSSAVLLDSSGLGNTANRTAHVACAPGVDGLAVDFNGANDAVTVADGASFAFTDHLAVAAWINPTKVSGTHTILEQQLGHKTTFSLAIHKGALTWSVTLAGNHLVTATTPITANTWSHVAGTYDGQSLSLYLDGQQVGQESFAGTLEDAHGPIEIGNNAAGESFAGAIDNVWIAAAPVALDDIDTLACVEKAPALSAAPTAGPPSIPDTPVDYTITVTNTNVGTCPPALYIIDREPPQGFTETTPSDLLFNVATGASTTFPLTVNAVEQSAPGVYPIPFRVQNLASFTAHTDGQVSYDLTAPNGCFVYIDRELMMVDLSVVEDPLRTTWTGPASDPRTGAWTFAALMRDLAPTPDQAPAMVEQLMSTWLDDQTVGGFTVSARPSMQQMVLDSWPRTANGALDLTRAPLRLSAIVDRLDVRNLDQGKAGEGRFVFSVLDPSGNPLQFTLIVEYALPATTDADVLTWAHAWHALGSHPFPSEEYNAALQALTQRFTGRGASPSQPNGSALAQLRTDEIALSFSWELREFHLSPTTGLLQEAPVALTPDLGFDGNPQVADFVNQNQAALLTQLFSVPQVFEGAPFQGGSALNPAPVFWSGPDIVDNDARQLFSLNTCNGCHGQETGTDFLHIAPRSLGQRSDLSGFLTGIRVPDPVSGVTRTYGDLAARKADLTSLVCAATPPPKAHLRNGRRRVH